MKGLRLAVVGCGRVFERFHYPALRASGTWDLAGAVDNRSDRREWVKRVEPHTRVYERLDDLLAASRPDAVLIATPPTSHAQLACAALAAGCPVLVEKPMALDCSDAQRMVDSARAFDRALLVGFNRRFRRPYRRLRDMIREVEPNAVTGVRHRMVFDAAGYGAVTDYLRSGPGAGVLDDVASHQLDLLPWILGSSPEAVRVVRQERTPDGGESYDIELRLDGGLTIACTAGHAGRYQETLELNVAERRILCHATGLVRGRWLPAEAMRLWARIEGLRHLAVHKMIGRPNITLMSFIDQLRVFAEVTRGSGSIAAADAARAECGYRCVRAIAACRASLVEGGAWKDVA